MDVEWLTSSEACDRLGVTLRTLYRLIDRGQLPAYKIGRLIRLRSEDLNRFVDQGGHDPDDPGGEGPLVPARPKPPLGGGGAAVTAELEPVEIWARPSIHIPSTGPVGEAELRRLAEGGRDIGRVAARIGADPDRAATR